MKDLNEPNIFVFPVITLYQPWATWIMRGWKTIETRTHNKFACLLGKVILIHAGKTDNSVNAVKNLYLTPEQILQAPDEMINGYILGSALVERYSKLSSEDSLNALIDCWNVERYGLFLTDVVKYDKPIPVKGERGIWYFNLIKKEKVKNSNILRRKSYPIKPKL